MFTLKNFVICWASFWCSCSCDHKMVIITWIEIWSYGSIRDPNLQVRFHHLIVAATAVTKVGLTHHGIFNSVLNCDNSDNCDNCDNSHLTVMLEFKHFLRNFFPSINDLINTTCFIMFPLLYHKCVVFWNDKKLY